MLTIRLFQRLYRARKETLICFWASFALAAIFWPILLVALCLMGCDVVIWLMWKTVQCAFIWPLQRATQHCQSTVLLTRQRHETEKRQAAELARQTKLRALQHTDSIAKALVALEIRRRELFGLYVTHKPFLDAGEWQETTFIDFASHEANVRAGNINSVFSRLTALQATLERVGIIGRLKLDYQKRRPVIGQDISERAFESLIAGIPITGDFLPACDEVQRILVQAFEHRAPAWKESQDDQHLDNLLDAMESADDGIESHSEIVPLKRRSS